jgi:hypothetical protein
MKDIAIGTAGTLGTFGLAELHLYLGIAAGLMTCTYMSIRLYKEFKKK